MPLSNFSIYICASKISLHAFYKDSLENEDECMECIVML